jgi:hypothetical protein
MPGGGHAYHERGHVDGHHVVGQLKQNLMYSTACFGK